MGSITPQTNLFELLEEHPELKQVFERHRIPWVEVTCLDKTRNTVEDVSAICGLFSDEIVDELNQMLASAG